MLSSTEKSLHQHQEDLLLIQQQIRQFTAEKKLVRIYHGSTNTTRKPNLSANAYINISQLTRILELNHKEQYVIVEPNVPMDRLVHETLQFGLIPPVVMEFPGITVGGGVQGGALESSSFKYGAFHQNCLEYEIILGNGQIITASKEENADLYWGVASSYGSLGIITKIKLTLIPAKPYVLLRYQPVSSFTHALECLQQQALSKIDFLDSIMFAKNSGIVMSGNFTDRLELPVTTFHKATDQWFYLNAQQALEKNIQCQQIPIEDYLFRYDRGAFWMGRYGFNLCKIPFHHFTRTLFNKLFKTRLLYSFLHDLNVSQQLFIQDIDMPQEKALEFLHYIDDTLAIYPLWLCPIQPGQQDFLSPFCLNSPLVFNIGIWGEMNKSYQDFWHVNREVEQKLIKLGGRKMLYAHSYSPAEEFWQLYDKAHYTELRKKYSAKDVFLDIHSKTFVTECYQKKNLFATYLRIIRALFSDSD